MKTLVITQRELLRETGLSPRRLRALEKAVGIRPQAVPRRAYTLSECLRVMEASLPALKKRKR